MTVGCTEGVGIAMCEAGGAGFLSGFLNVIYVRHEPDDRSSGLPNLS